MSTFFEQKFESLGLEQADESEIYCHSENSVRNPLPSQAKIGDYYIKESDGWQRRYIVDIDGKQCGYATFFLENYSLGNSFEKDDTGRFVRVPPKTGNWEMPYETICYCSLSHIRSWSQK